MSTIHPETVWLACPQCRWRREFPRDAVSAAPRCTQCGGAVIVSAPPEVRAATPELMEELTLEPVELPPTSGVQHVTTPTVEIPVSPLTAPRIPPRVPSDVRRGSVQIEKQHDGVVEPPRKASLYWAFTNNVFDFPFKPPSLLQLVVASIGLIVASEFCMLAWMGVASGSMAGALQAGTLGIAAFFASLFAISYLAACLLDIVVNAAYNLDKSHDWPNPDWRERLLTMLRLFWMCTLAGVPAAAIAGVAGLVGDYSLPVFTVTFFLLFPVLLLAGLEVDSLFWPVSRPIFRSVKKLWYAWGAFYLVAGCLWGVVTAIHQVFGRRLTLSVPIWAAPLWVVTIFAYGRLLGRLAWYIVQNGDAEPDKKARQRALEQERWDI